MKDRIKAVRLNAGLNQTEFGSILGVKQATIAGYESGARVPIDAVITSICREFGVSETWLRTGAGDMFIPRDPDQELQDALAEITVSDDPLIRRIILAYWGLDAEERAAVQKLIDGLIAEKEPPGD